VYKKNKWIKNTLEYNSSNRDSSIIFLKKGFDNIQFKHIEIDSVSHFVLNGGGPVLKLNENKIERIDNSVEQRNQFGAAVFQHNNQLHMYGGYGFWEWKGYITYYDPLSNQWELCKFDTPLQPSPRWKPLFHKKNEFLYVLGGRSSFKESRNIDTVLRDFFKINLNDKKVELITQEVNSQIPLFSSSFQGFEIRDKKAYVDYSNSSILVLDFDNNSMTSFSTGEMFKNKHLRSPVLVVGDSIVFIEQIKNNKTIKFVSLNEIFKNTSETFPIVLVDQNRTYTKYLTIPITALLIFFLFKIFSYKDYIRNLIAHDYQWLYFQNQKVRITQYQREVIKLLEQKGGFTSQELNKLLSPNAKSHLTLLRNNFIEKLNSDFKKLTNNPEPLISSIKNPNDKRQLLYKSNQKISQKESFLKFLFRLG
jgi:Fe2+ or Zn2+ uptake regulation protein